MSFGDSGTMCKWVRRFTLDGWERHKGGFTIYKITSYIFPLASPEAVTVLTVWKRYSDLQHLQRMMKKMHQELHLKGTCPSFTKWGYFRRFDPDVIVDRIKSTQALLEFVALHPPLFTSSEFVKFFQSSYPDPEMEAGNTGNIESIRRSLLLPVEVIGPMDNSQTSEDDSFSTVDSNSVSPMDASPDDKIVYRNDAGQPIATYPKSPRKDSGKPYKGVLEDVAEIVVLPEPLLPKAKETNPEISPTSDQNVTEINLSSSDLEQTITNSESVVENSEENGNGEIAKQLTLPDLLEFETKVNMDVSQISSGSSTDSLSFLDSPSFNSNDNSKSLRDNDLISFTRPSESIMSLQAGFSNDSVIRTRKKSAPNVGSRDTVDSASFMSSRSSSRLDTMSIDSLMGSTSDLQESYVFEAGYLLSLGARNEAKGEYQKAFDFYKAGIEKMLIGVQGDTNEFRRQFVRDKTNKYLSYAEKIYNQHLNNLDSLVSEMSPLNTSCPPVYRPLKTCDVSSLRQPYEDLSKYRVLGIIGGQVMLVLCSETQSCYAMKVIQKTCNQIPDEDFFTSSVIVDNQLPIMPADIPYMVKLTAFVDTPNLLFLVLQYASGGKLFDYIKNYVKTVPQTPKREVNLENVFIDPEEMNKKRNRINCLIAEEAIEYDNIPIELDKSSIRNRINCLSTEEMIELNDHLIESDKQPIQSNKPSIGSNKHSSNLNNEAIKPDKQQSNQNIAVSVTSPDNLNLSVSDIVNNSQRLLLNVDDALNGRFSTERESKDCGSGGDQVNNCDNRINDNRLGPEKLGIDLDKSVNDLEERMEGVLVDGETLKYTIQGNRSALPPKSLCNWGAELLTAIDHLHQCGVYCRNLSPVNLLLGERGHLVLSYIVGWEMRQTLTSLMNEGRLLGDLYVAPEIQRFPLLNENYDQRLGDFWSFGAIMYELLTGLPLCITHPTGFSSHTILNIPEGLPQDAESLLSQLLCYDPHERLGSGSSGIKDIKSHEYFKQIDWDHVQQIYEECL